jgi:hypothetical protein
VPLRSHSLSMNRALMAAGLVDHAQVTLFPVITGQTGLDPIAAILLCSSPSAIGGWQLVR